MHPLLEARRNSDTPKCATCGWWSGGEGPAGTCGYHKCETLDLAVCTAWRDGEVSQQVLPPEQDE